MKLLVDMNLAPAWCGFLAGEGFEAVHWSTIGNARAPDSELMAWARRHRSVVLTHDLDFGILLAITRASSPSVVQVRVPNPLPEIVGRDVVRVLRLRGDLLAAGALVTIEKLKDRVRVLPFEGSPGGKR
jgi:predicted nuclease of predicted toxin-antitoxin system